MANAAHRLEPAVDGPPVLVSVIVRSMDRPELDATLEALAAQDHPALEIIVVDATGGRHRPLAPRRMRAGHSARMICAGRPLLRAHAADFGLADARGEWFTFLDDDDSCAPTHVSGLVAASKAHPEALVIYGCGRLLDAEGRLDRVFGRPFNRALMHFGPLFYWQASLIRTSVRELGCRFDTSFEVCEDRDFLAQVSAHGDFAFAPDLATFDYRPDLGTSGTGAGVNRDLARVARFENQLRAKWAGPGTWHNERAAVQCRRGVRAFHAGDVAGAARIFTQALAQYPDDPNALHGLARTVLAQGDYVRAARLVREALKINPLAEEYRATLAAIPGAADAAAPAAAAVSRLAPCPCGSGRKFKACCGQMDAGAAASVVQGQALCAQAQRALDAGDAPAAFALLQQAASLRRDAVVGRLLETCCAKLVAPLAQASMWSTIRAVCGASSDAPDAHGDDVPDPVAAAAEGRTVFRSPDEVPAHGVTGPGPARALVVARGDDAEPLLRALARLAEGWPATRLDYRMVSL